MRKFVIDTTSDKRGCEYCAFYGTKHCKGYHHPSMFMCREIRRKGGNRFSFKEVT